MNATFTNQELDNIRTLHNMHEPDESLHIHNNEDIHKKIWISAYIDTSTKRFDVDSAKEVKFFINETKEK